MITRKVIHAVGGQVISDSRAVVPASTLPRPPPLPEPTRLEMMGHAGTALVKWVKAGAPIVPAHVRVNRYAVCMSCELWDDEARLGLGKCTHSSCGCTKLKLALATESCPIGKWPAYKGQLTSPQIQEKTT